VVKKAEAEAKAAVDELKAQEDAYHNKINELKSKAEDAALSTVAKSKAANELATLKQEDPLPLRKAKVTQEAALRKVEKERKAAENATSIARDKARAAEDAAKELEEKTRQVEESVRQTELAMKDAEESLEYVKKKGGAAKGSLWWVDREIKEAQKYMPKKKQTA